MSFRGADVLRAIWLSLGAQHRALRYRYRKDPAGVRFIREVLRPGDVAIDIGAYKGVYTHWMLRAVGSTGRVIAFEPQREMAARLRLTLRGFPNLTVEELGLSDQPGERELIVPGQRPSSTATFETNAAAYETERDPKKVGDRRYPVKVETLDRCLAGRELAIRLIKCDVEGHELRVFRGASAILREHRPALIFESLPTHHAVDQVEDVLAYLGQLGYRGSFFQHGELLPLDARGSFSPKDYAFVPEEWARPG